MRGFWLYWTAATASYFGDGLRVVALPLLALTLTTSPAGVAAVGVASGLPWLLFGLLAGVLVDRLPRLRLMVTLDVLRTGLAATLAVAAATGRVSLPLLVAVVFLLSSCEVLADVTTQATLPSLVTHDRLQWANGRLMTAEVVVSEFLGPALGGLLFAVAVALPFGLDAATFLTSALCLAVVARGTRAGPAQPATAGTSVAAVVHDLREGVLWFARHRFVLALSLLGATVNFGLGGFYAVLVLYARDSLGLGPTGYGLLIAVSAAGSVSAGLVANRLSAPSVRRRACLAVAPLVGGVLLVMAAQPTVPVAALAMVAIGFAVTLANVVTVTLRQLSTPDAMLGRVTAAHRFLAWGSLPLGAALAGGVGEVRGVPTAIAACGLAVVAAGAAVTAALAGTPESAYDPAVQPTAR